MSSSFTNNGKISADGGQNGSGGQIHFVQVGKEYTKEGITIKDVKRPHREYWGYVLRSSLIFFKKYFFQILVGLVIAYLASKFGWR
ncbi:MAG: hypothetical protein AAB447_01255 [Patescibacteria group bacterium]